MNTKTTAKDFFLQLSVVILLYAGTVALLNILFNVINVAFPQVGQYYGSPSISFPVATLIVVFPLFLFLANLVRKSYVADSNLKDYPVRKWLIYITLFVAGAVLAGDLVTLIYYFLDGRELTLAFFLKVLSVLVVTGSIFGYYLDDLKDRLTGTRRNIWRVVATILVIGSIVAGFSVLGTPQSQRLFRYDSLRVGDLQNIQWQVVNYWQQKGSMPNSLQELQDPISGFQAPLDPQSKEPYEYIATGQTSFDLCAVFSKSSQTLNSDRVQLSYPDGVGGNWQHEAGRVCFSRVIDPEFYPVRLK